MAIREVAHGHLLRGVLAFIVLKFVGVGLVAFVFDLTRDKLLAIGWFARFYTWIILWRDRAHAFIAPYKAAVRARIAVLKARIADLEASSGKGGFLDILARLRARVRRAQGCKIDRGAGGRLDPDRVSAAGGSIERAIVAPADRKRPGRHVRRPGHQSALWIGGGFLAPTADAASVAPPAHLAAAMMDDDGPPVMVHDDRPPVMMDDDGAPVMDDDLRLFDGSLDRVGDQGTRRDRRGFGYASHHAQAQHGGDNAVSEAFNFLPWAKTDISHAPDLLQNGYRPSGLRAS